MQTNALTNPDAELGVIGCCLVGGLMTTLEAIQTLPATAFMEADTSEAWLVLESMANQGKEVSPMSFAQEWPRYCKSPLPDRIMRSPDSTPSASNLSYYGALLTESYQRRQVSYAGSALSNHAGDRSKTVDQVVSEAERILLDQQVDSSKTLDGKSGSEQLSNFLEESFLLHQAGKRSGITTGFSQFDRITDGIQKGELTIIAARPSVGKTAIGLNIVERACIIDDIPTAVITLEMSARSLMRRMCSSWTRIPLNQLKTGAYMGNAIQSAKVVSFFTIIRKSNLKIHEAINGADVAKLASVIRRLVKMHSIQLVVVDYLQKIKAPEKHEKRTYEVAQVSGTLKAVAVQTGVAMLTLAQLNRDSEKDKPRMPRLTDLADSGQIERDADTVALLHRTRSSDNPKESKLLIAKQRDGELGLVDLSFDGPICRFSDEH